MVLSKKEIEEEIQSIGESITAHTQQKELHEKMIKREEYLKELVEKDLKSRE